MTNRELLQTPKKLLGEVDRQRLFVLQVEGTRQPCPACRVPVSALDATGLDLDAYDFGVTAYSYRRPGCRAELDQSVPIIQ